MYLDLLRTKLSSHTSPRAEVVNPPCRRVRGDREVVRAERQEREERVCSCIAEGPSPIDGDAPAGLRWKTRTCCNRGGEPSCSYIRQKKKVSRSFPPPTPAPHRPILCLDFDIKTESPSDLMDRILTLSSREDVHGGIGMLRMLAAATEVEALVEGGIHSPCPPPSTYGAERSRRCRRRGQTRWE